MRLDIFSLKLMLTFKGNSIFIDAIVMVPVILYSVEPYSISLCTISGVKSRYKFIYELDSAYITLFFSVEISPI